MPSIKALMELRTEANHGCISMNNLNDDCLLHIFKFVGLSDRLYVEIVCRRWQDLCFLLWKRTCSFDVTDKQLGFEKPEKYSGLKSKDDINVNLCQVVFSKCYLNLTEINLTRSIMFDATLLTGAVHGCPVNHDELGPGVLNTLQGSLQGTLNHLKNPMANLQCIQKLSLCYCVINVDDEFLKQLFEKNRKLHSIALSKYLLTGECFAYLSSEIVYSVSLYGCEMNFKDLNVVLSRGSNLHTFELSEILDLGRRDSRIISPSSINLLQLSLDYCELQLASDLFKSYVLTNLELKFVGLEDHMVKLIVDNCKQLRQFDVRWNEELTDVCLPYTNELPNLKCLGIGFNDNFTDAGLQTLTQHYLRELDVSDTNFSASGLLQLTQKMQYLELLDVSFLEDLDHTFVESVIDIVKSRPNKIPLKIGIFDTVIESNRIKNLCPLVKLFESHCLSMNHEKYV